MSLKHVPRGKLENTVKVSRVVEEPLNIQNPVVGQVVMRHNDLYMYCGDGVWKKVFGESSIIAPNLQRCEYCGTLIRGKHDTHCKSCGAPI